MTWIAGKAMEQLDGGRQSFIKHYVKEDEINWDESEEPRIKGWNLKEKYYKYCINYESNDNYYQQHYNERFFCKLFCDIFLEHPSFCNLTACRIDPGNEVTSPVLKLNVSSHSVNT
jgi:hypothetical protein